MKNLAYIKNTRNLELKILGYASFAFLFLASVYFYKERIYFADSAFQFFKILNFEKINVEAYRYGAILPELPLILAMKLGFNLKTLTIIFSASFILLYFIIFLFCVHLLKNISAGLSIVLVLIICISQSFFHPVTETHQSLVFSILVFATLQYPFRNQLIQGSLASLGIAISFLAHPVAVYALIFVIGYSAIDKKQLRFVIPYLLLTLVMGLTVGKVLFTDENSYEGKFFSELLNSPAIILDLPNAYSTKFFLNRIPRLYFWVMILECYVGIILLLKKEYLKLLWQLGTIIFFLIVTLLTYNKGDSDMMMERAFMPLALFICLPFLKETLQTASRYQYVKITFLIAIITFSFIRIYSQGMKFRERTRFNQELLAKTAKLPNRKFIVQISELQKYHIAYWSYSFETLMLSTITKDIPTQTIFPANDTNKYLKYTEGAGNIFLGADFWLEWEIDNLNHKYFNLSTELPYAIIKTDEF